MASAAVTPGALATIRASGTVEGGVTLRVADLSENNGNNKLKCTFSDGKESLAGLITSQVRRGATQAMPGRPPERARARPRPPAAPEFEIEAPPPRARQLP